VSELAAPSPSISAQTDLYAIFLNELESLDKSIVYDEGAVASHFGIERVQARAWLTRARRENRIPSQKDAEKAKSGSY
jgi:hypothetical protein